MGKVVKFHIVVFTKYIFSSLSLPNALYPVCSEVLGYNQNCSYPMWTPKIAFLANICWLAIKKNVYYLIFLPSCNISPFELPRSPPLDCIFGTPFSFASFSFSQDNLSRSSDSARSVDLVVLRSSPGDQFGGKDKKEKSSGSSDKEKRKRSTLSDVFNPTYKSRSEEFKRIFGKVRFFFSIFWSLIL